VRMRLPAGLEARAAARSAVPVVPEVVPRASPPGRS